MGRRAQQGLGQQHGGGALEHIHQKHHQGRAFAHLAQHVGGAGGAGAQLAQIDAGTPAARQVAAGDGAEQIGGQQH